MLTVGTLRSQKHYEHAWTEAFSITFSIKLSSENCFTLLQFSSAMLYHSNINSSSIDCTNWRGKYDNTILNSPNAEGSVIFSLMLMESWVNIQRTQNISEVLQLLLFKLQLCNTVLLRSSRNILCTLKLHPTFRLCVDERFMISFSFFGWA